MKIPATELKAILRSLSAVSPDSLIFAGREVYAAGQNITVIAGLPVDLGTFGVATEKFVQLVSRLEGEVDLTVKEKLVIKSGRSRFTLPVLADGEVPRFKTPPGEYRNFGFKLFMEMLEFASQASKNEVFNYTGSVLFTSEQAVGTDGNRMAVIRSGRGYQHVLSILIPLPVIHALKTLKGDDIRISEEADSLWFIVGNSTIIARKLAKSFPAIDSHIPKTFQSKHLIKATDMLGAIRRIYPLLDDDKRITLTMNSDSVILSLSNIAGSAEDTIPAEQLLPDPAFSELAERYSVDSGALKDFYEAVEGDTMFCGNGPAKPIWIEAGNKKLLCSSKA